MALSGQLKNSKIKIQNLKFKICRYRTPRRMGDSVSLGSEKYGWRFRSKTSQRHRSMNHIQKQCPVYLLYRCSCTQFFTGDSRLHGSRFLSVASSHYRQIHNDKIEVGIIIITTTISLYDHEPLYTRHLTFSSRQRQLQTNLFGEVWGCQQFLKQKIIVGRSR